MMDSAIPILTEQQFSEMMQAAVYASASLEAGLKTLLKRELGSNGHIQTIHIPGQPKPIVLNGASDRELTLAALQALGFILQTTRVIAVALSNLDTRLRNQADPPTAQKVEDERGSQSPDAAAATECGHAAGVPTDTSGRKAVGNP